MRSFRSQALACAFACALATPALAAAQGPLPAGIWTNTEDAYFAEEEGRPRPAPVMIDVGAD